METHIRDDLLDAYGDIVINHILKHGPGWVVCYRTLGANQQHRVALYDADGEVQFDLVVGSDE